MNRLVVYAKTLYDVMYMHETIYTKRITEGKRVVQKEYNKRTRMYRYQYSELNLARDVIITEVLRYTHAPSTFHTFTVYHKNSMDLHSHIARYVDVHELWTRRSRNLVSCRIKRNK